MKQKIEGEMEKKAMEFMDNLNVHDLAILDYIVSSRLQSQKDVFMKLLFFKSNLTGQEINKYLQENL